MIYKETVMIIRLLTCYYCSIERIKNAAETAFGGSASSVYPYGWALLIYIGGGWDETK